MSLTPTYKPGDWNAVCSMCGQTFKASELVKNWQGQWRCRKHNEVRQPQDFVRGTVDNQTVPWSQSPSDIDIVYCTFNGRSAYPGRAYPGCVIPGNNLFIPSMEF